MNKFWLIQRGNFVDGTTGLLIGDNHVIRLQYMGSAEFEWGAIPKAYRRILYNASEYDVFSTGIFTPEHEELFIFCKRYLAAEIKQEVKEFIEHPYHLKEYSELEKVPNLSKIDTTYNRRRTNFWWCIDIKTYGDWMAFLRPQKEIFEKTFKQDLNEWWLKKSQDEREKEYQKSLQW